MILVILGLLTGGILAGQSLIRAAELRSLVEEAQRFVTATHTFRDKYFALPGDMNNATRFWGRNNTHASCVTNSAAAVTAPGTCDGDGDATYDNASAVSRTGERFEAWKQLALAGLIEGSYSGLAGSGTTEDHDPAVNAPQSRVSNGMWTISTLDNYVGNGTLYALDYGDFLRVGREGVSGPTEPLLRPEEAWNLDTKMDDGKPARGRIVSSHWDTLCSAPDTGVAANTNLNASYRLTDNSLQCSLIFSRLF